MEKRVLEHIPAAIEKRRLWFHKNGKNGVAWRDKLRWQWGKSWCLSMLDRYYSFPFMLAFHLEKSRYYWLYNQCLVWHSFILFSNSDLFHMWNILLLLNLLMSNRCWNIVLNWKRQHKRGCWTYYVKNMARDGEGAVFLGFLCWIRLLLTSCVNPCG